VSAWSLVGLIVVTALFANVFRTTNDTSLSSRLLIASVAVLSAVVGSVLVCGLVIHSLGPVWLLAVTALIGTMAVGALRITNHRAAIGLVAGEGAIDQATRPSLVGVFRAQPIVAVLAAVIAGRMAWSMLVAYALPSYAYDALWYHDTTVATWHQANRISSSDISRFSAYFPSTVESVGLWIREVTGSTQLIDASQVGFALAGCTAVVSLARSLGATREWSMVAAASFVLSPVALQQLSIHYVDLSLASLYIAMIAIGRRWADQRATGAATHNVAWIGALGSCLGMAAGTKFAGLGLCAVAVISAALHLWPTRHQERPWRQVGAAATTIGIAAAFGGYWYVRNWIHQGNPVAPIIVRIGGRTVFGGTEKTNLFINNNLDDALAKHGLWGRIWLTWSDWLPTANWSDLHGGFGPAWVIIGLPSLALLMFGRQRGRMVTSILIPLLMAMVATPVRWLPRFACFVPAFGGIAIAIVATQCCAWISTCDHVGTRAARRALGIGVAVAVLLPAVSAFTIHTV
jgi:hypothetical protein